MERAIESTSATTPCSTLDHFVASTTAFPPLDRVDRAPYTTQDSIASLQMQSLVEGVLAQVKPGLLHDSMLQGLRHIFPDSTILGALSLIDADKVSAYILSSGRLQYVVEGSTAASYTVHLNLGTTGSTICSCYAFIHGVLSAGTHIYCKHILAVRLALQMNRMIERRITEEEFANLIASQMRAS